MSAGASGIAAGPARPLWMKVAIGLALLLAALMLLLILFPWDLLRGPVNRYVSDKTGRHFEITRKLDVRLGRSTRVLLDGVEFANPSWASDPFLVQAEAAEVEVRLFPLLRGRIELPSVTLRQPQLGLQAEADGRRSWALGRDSSDPASVPEIGKLVIDQGSARYLAPHQGADIRVDFAVDTAGSPSVPPGAASPGPSSSTPAAAPVASGVQVPAASPPAGPAPAVAPQELPLRFEAKGTWQGEPFSATGRTGNVLALSAPLERPFPAQLSATAAGTRLNARGTVASLATLEGIDVQFALQGGNLADLYQLVGVVLPATPRYDVQGRLSMQAQVWQVRELRGQLGRSDLAGQLSFDRSQPVGLLAGELSSRVLDFNDLAPLVGLPELGGDRGAGRAAAPPTGSAKTPAGARAASRRSAGRAGAPPPGKVLPTAALDAALLKAMNADVRYSAARVANTPNLPLDRISLHVLLKQGVLQLEPLDLGVAGGSLAGRLRIDGNTEPATAAVKLDGRAMQLNKLFPGTETTKTSFGKVHGGIELQGRGNSVAQMLGTSSGNVALLMGKGQISNLLLELAGLDGGEIIRFLVSGDENVGVRCAATAFDVQRGLMTTRAFVLDTTDTVIYGNGTVSLATETLDLTLQPYPKDVSILSLRSPLKVSGSFAAPRGTVDVGAVAGRAGLALALGAINPLLALAATIETGPGQDADCGAALRDASSPQAAARIQGSAATRPPPDAEKAAQPRPPQSRGRPGAHYPLDPRPAR